MTRFSLKHILRMTFLVLFRTKDSPAARLTPKRMGVLLLFYLLYIPIELVTWLCLALDEVFFHGYHRVEVAEPVFIIGNPRSGTTFLHRLLARDDENFTYLRLWEILFAPSVTQRKLGLALAALDRKIGNPIKRLIAFISRKMLASHTIHRMGLFMPEEDEYLLAHLGSTIVAGIFFGFPSEAYPFVFFDTELGPREKRRVMNFYRRCLKRHFYAHGYTQGVTKHYLSKNPYFTPKVDALYRYFPDAKIIYLVRSPLNVVPSYASLSAYWWHELGDPVEEYPFQEYVLTSTQYWYRYPPQRLEQEPPERHIFVKFDDMTGDPETTVQRIYQNFGLEISPEFATILEEETEKARQYRSKHRYALEDMNFTREQILNAYADVFERWGFATGEEEEAEAEELSDTRVAAKVE